MKLYKVLGADGAAVHGGKGKWSLPQNDLPGKWLSVEGPLIPCEHGLHLCRRGDLVVWVGPVIYEAEHEGELIEASDKVVVRKARLLRRVDKWTEPAARLFAADCAEHVLPIFEVQYPDDDRPRKAIEAARAFARGEISAAVMAAACAAAGSAACAAAGSAASAAAWAAARAAAGAAAWAAVMAAAWAAAWTAAWTATWDAAGDAAGAAAWAASRDATWDATWDAEREWQTERLFAYLEGRV